MNYNKYIGLPYASNGRSETGVDCWGLACLFYRDELGIELPSYSELYSTASDPQVVQAINQHRDNWLLTTDAVAGDLCLFNIYGEPAHVGIYVGGNHFLHAREGRDSVVESLSSPQWSKRFQGFYRYSTQPQVLSAGAPHPLKSQVAYDWTVAGTTVEDFANFVNTKYSVSERFASQLAVTVDGVLIPRDKWATTVLLANQTVAYKSVAQGRNTTRLLLTLAVVVAVSLIAPQLAPEAAAAVKAGTATFAQTATFAATTAALNMAGMALVNAIAPIRMPGQNPDPGSAAGLNLFSGASNQPNRFGAIPVVLGRMRVTGVLGATPYIDTLTDTSLINLLIIWGFGPLSVGPLSVGTSPIENYYGEEFAQDFPAPVTLTGRASEDATAFNNLYPRDVEQQQVGVLLVNNAEDGNPWQNVVFAQDNTTSIDLAFTFPEGMRQLVISGGDAGKVREATAGVEIQVRKKSANGTFPQWAARPSYTHGAYDATTPNSAEYTDSINKIGYSQTVSQGGDSGDFTTFTPLYQWFTYALSDSGEIRRFDGAATDSQNSEPSAALINFYQSSSYNSLLGNDANTATYSRIPELPLNGYIKLYTVCTYNGLIVETINHLQNYSGYSGLVLTTEPITVDSGQFDEGGQSNFTTVGTKLNISSGAVYALSSNQPIAGVSQVIFNANTLPGVTPAGSFRTWSQFLKDNGVWFGDTANDFNQTKTETFPRDGYYHIEASADDEGAVYVNNRQVVGIPKPGYSSTVSNLVYLEAGTYPVRVTAKNSGGGNAGVACKISYTENGGLNNLPTPNTILVFGTPGFYNKRKDAFNFVYKIKNLPQGTYEIRVKRVNDDSSEPAEELRNYNKVSLLSATAYANPLDEFGNPQGPLNQIPNTYLARSAIRLQSTSKANGTVDGVNAVVQTIASDWDRNFGYWTERQTSNPASLFAYVLMHPGNAYRIKPADVSQQIDVAALQSWHEFCDDNQFEFNSVVTQTQGVMDILRDICAAGKASPAYVDGKWTVIVDRPRAYVTQHFTPHNSWGFESTKLLPRLPDAFRVTFANESKGYQADEAIVFNFGKTKATAEVFEELSLPGVTNELQAKRMARWHLAQLKLRPETYTLNVDFEYLVCTRGDLVRVSHDVPLWGTATGRIKSISTNTLVLTEQAYLESGKTYDIRIRVNSISTVTNSDSLVYTLTPVTTGWYSTVTLTENISASVEVDNLFMLGEIYQQSQELVVIGVEPQDNLSARITLADYSPEIYSVNLDDDNAQLPSFNANITGQSATVVQTTITQAPVISGVVSDSSLAEEISTGIYQNVLIVSFGNVPDLSKEAKYVQLQIILGDTDFDSSTLNGLYTADKATGSITATGLKTLTIYKMRARYTNATGSVSGPWSEIYYATAAGKIENFYTVPTIELDLENTYIVASPSTTLALPADFAAYEYRLYKDTGVEDFWELNTTSNNILVVRSSGVGRFDLLNMPTPRISQSGVTYRVACRTVDRSNNYSSTSALGTIVVKTIQ